MIDPTKLAVLILFLTSCGFGFANDAGDPIPASDYWGWQCWDGGSPNPDSGCPPPPSCDDQTAPMLEDAGLCLCADGTTLPAADCEAIDGG